MRRGQEDAETAEQKIIGHGLKRIRKKKNRGQEGKSFGHRFTWIYTD